MNKATRLLVTTGMAIVAGATMGVGAASASPKTPDAPAAVQAAKPGPGWNNDRVVGYYGSPRFCNFFGQRGENRNRWDDYRCIYQRRGPHHGQFALLVSWGATATTGTTTAATTTVATTTVATAGTTTSATVTDLKFRR